MLTTKERQLQFVELVQSMRTAQKELCRLHDRLVSRVGLRDEIIEHAKYCERQVDRALRRLEQRELFDESDS